MLLIQGKTGQAINKDTVNSDIHQQTLSAIVLNISPYFRIKTANTAKEAWTKLEKAFENTVLIIPLYIYENLMILRKNRGLMLNYN